mmetsp:Transcript_22782/g.43804  ORF Transcript_22782/g.43804 Transcript_22782/m.43804 type:complete len:414 (-) Transcript_22782:136-1377(-)
MGRRIALLLSCLACAAHGRRVHMADRSTPEASQEAHRSRRVSFSSRSLDMPKSTVPKERAQRPLHALARTLAMFHPAEVGWQMSNAGHGCSGDCGRSRRAATRPADMQSAFSGRHAGADLPVRWHRSPRMPARHRDAFMEVEVKEKAAGSEVEQASREDEIMSDDPMVIRIEEECARMNGQNWSPELGLQQLLNPSKVINLERDLIDLRAKLNATTASEERIALQEKIDEKEKKQQLEMRGVMQDWLKAVFVWQSVLSVVIFGLISYDALPGFPNLDLVVQVIGFWGIWLFTIPSLRSRKPGGTWGMSKEEKRALDISFLLTPVANLGVPFITKDIPTIFWTNLAVLAACYAYGFLAPAAEKGGNADASLPAPIKFALTALDFGAGAERGMSADRREAYEAEMRKKKEEEKKR